MRHFLVSQLQFPWRIFCPFSPFICLRLRLESSYVSGDLINTVDFDFFLGLPSSSCGLIWTSLIALFMTCAQFSSLVNSDKYSHFKLLDQKAHSSMRQDFFKEAIVWKWVYQMKNTLEGILVKEADAVASYNDIGIVYRISKELAPSGLFWKNKLSPSLPPLFEFRENFRVRQFIRLYAGRKFHENQKLLSEHYIEKFEV